MAIKMRSDVPLNPLAAKPEPIKPAPPKAQEPKSPAKPVTRKPKPQVPQPVEPSGKRGRPSTGQARTPVTIRLDADLVEEMAKSPDWREAANAILRAHFLPNQF